MGIGEDLQLEERLFHAPAVEGVKELTAGQGGQGRRAGPVDALLLIEENEEKGRQAAGGDEDALEADEPSPGPRDDGLVGLAGRPRHDVRVDGIDAQGQGGQAVRHQVDPEDLDGQERNGEAEQGGREHDQDLAQVAGQQEVDELADVVVDAPAFLDGGHDRGEVVVGDDHVRDFLGHVRPGDAHGDTDVGLLDRGRVVDAVAGHGHDLALAPPGPDGPELVLGRDPGVDRHPLDGRLELGVAEAVDILAGQGLRVFAVKAELAGDGHGRVPVVAGDHHRPYARHPALGHGLPDLGPRRVDHGHEPGEGQVLFDRLGLIGMGLLVEGPVSDGQDAQGLVRIGVVGLHDPVAVGDVERPLRAVLEDEAAVVEQEVRGALGEHRHVLVGPADDAHLLALRVERKLLDELEGVFLLPFPDAGLGRGAEDGDLRRVAEDGGLSVLDGQLGVVAEDPDDQGLDQVGVDARVDDFRSLAELAEGVVARARHLEGVARGPDGQDGHLVFGQGARLVRADDRGAAQGLDRGQLADEDMAPDHALDAQGQGDGHDGGEPFGNGRHGQADRGQEHVEDLAAPEDLQAEDDGDEDEAEVDEELAELLELPLQGRRFFLDVLDETGDPSELGLHARFDDEGPGFTRDDDRARVEDIGALGQGDILLFEDDVGLVDGRRLAGQAGLLDGKVGGVPADPAVGRDVVPGFDLDEVARDELPGGNDPGGAVPDDFGRRGRQLFKSGQAFFGPVFLGETEDGVEDDDGQDGQGVHPLLEEARDEGGADEDPDDQPLELVEEDGQGTAAFFLLKLVGTQGLELIVRRRGGEARFSIRFESPGDLLDAEVPPFRHRTTPPGIMAGSEAALYTLRPERDNRAGRGDDAGEKRPISSSWP